METVFETPYSSFVMVFACTSKIWCGLDVRRSSLLYALHAKPSADDSGAVAKDGLSTKP